MTQITIQVEKEDARILVACIGMALGIMTSQTTPLLVMIDPRLSGLYRSLFTLLSNNETSRQVHEKIQAGKLDDMLDQTDIKMLQLADLMHSLLWQTDPNEMTTAQDDLPSKRFQ